VAELTRETLGPACDNAGDAAALDDHAADSRDLSARGLDAELLLQLSAIGRTLG